MARDLRKVDGDLELLIARIASLTAHIEEMRKEALELMLAVTEASAVVKEALA